MPTSDAPSLVRDRQDLPRLGKLPADPETVRVVEAGPVHDDQGVGRRVLFAWPAPRLEREAVREWRVYVRPADAPRFDLLGIAEESSLYPCCTFDVGTLYEVAVVAIGLDGPNHRPPEDSRSRTLFQLYGQEPVPPAPTAVTSRVVDDRILVTWTAPEYPAPVKYAVHVGSENVDGSSVVSIGRESFALLPSIYPPGVQFDLLVSAMTATGLVGPPGVGTATLTAPGDMESVKTADDAGWTTGSSSDVSVIGTDLVMAADATSGSYTSLPVDVGAVGTYTLAAVVQARIENAGLTWAMSWFRWDSAEAGRRRWDGGTAEWFPTGEFSRPESPAWDELEETWDDYAWLTWDAFGEERSTDDPSTLTWDEADFTWESAFAASWTWDGPVSSVGTGWALEVAFSDNGSTYSDWEAYAQQTRTFRYLKWRVVLTQPSPALTVTIESMDMAVLQLRAKGQRWEEETPVGVLNGVNDTFDLTYSPNPVKSLSLILDGALVRPTLYTLTGAQIVFGVAPIGTWILARYQR